uniref:Uncharacterized protein n=1 Tax=Chromera velia CCMP2878 TaxID=1169474 RepID=A0A0G4IBG4_9ALVE|eukprot:Cvel_12822.t1-p1 / transcript=Cvel_12822.t1 / gene=Cvel_12822 / organism=Chromera_velia_CCMP2878 / gene_product=hypothetical protein / transcript_product=hypothetical protein / location=Cvel_scaffold855:5437-6225(+) / protein_length=263 / sequence_SO=supercontig / SO=protein_coding / is_pseudo=false
MYQGNIEACDKVTPYGEPEREELGGVIRSAVLGDWMDVPQRWHTLVNIPEKGKAAWPSCYLTELFSSKVFRGWPPAYRLIAGQLWRLHEGKMFSGDKWEGVVTAVIAMHLLLLEWGEWYPAGDLLPADLFGSRFGGVIEDAPAMNAAKLWKELNERKGLQPKGGATEDTVFLVVSYHAKFKQYGLFLVVVPVQTKRVVSGFQCKKGRKNLEEATVEPTDVNIGVWLYGNGAAKALKPQSWIVLDDAAVDVLLGESLKEAAPLY